MLSIIFTMKGRGSRSEESPAFSEICTAMSGNALLIHGCHGWILPFVYRSLSRSLARVPLFEKGGLGGIWLCFSAQKALNIANSKANPTPSPFYKGGSYDSAAWIAAYAVAWSVLNG